MPELLTVGHSNHDPKCFLRLVRSVGITVIADVRSWPVSRHASWADRDKLPQRLRSVGIHYVFLGNELGGRPGDQDCYDADGHVLYGRVARTASFQAGLTRLLEGCAQHRVALMCSEEDPTHCHRRLLIAKVALQHGVAVRHVRADGRFQRELGIGPQAPGLFDDEDHWWRSTRSVSRRRRLSTSSPA